MKRFISGLLTLAMLAAMTVIMIPAASAAWDGSSVSAGLIGSGSEFDPYLITSENDLAFVAKQVNEAVSSYEGEYLKLTVDLDLGNKLWLVDRINRQRACHIITLEDPIEFLHRNQKSIVSQREIAVDTSDYLSALRACLRQAPDVIQLGEMRDLETIRTAMTAAETGHLLLGTLHTKGAVNTIDRIIDTFPSDQQEQIRIQLSMVLRTVVSQQLVPDVDGGQIPVFEIMHMTGAIRSMIRDCKNHQLPGAIASGSSEGMVSMDQSLFAVWKAGRITRQTALEYADNPEQMLRRLG